MIEFKTISNSNIIIRLDLNVPVKEGVITNDFRIRESIPTINELLLKQNNVIILAHLGDKSESLQVVANRLMTTFTSLNFIASTDLNIIKSKVNEIYSTNAKGNLILLENVRLLDGEIENSDALAGFYRSLADYYVFDAFSVAHRKQASTHRIAMHFDKGSIAMGPLCSKELELLRPALSPDAPALLLLGGAKISTKLPLIQRYLSMGVKVFVGGAMAHNIMLAKGIDIHNSFHDDTPLPADILNNPNLYIPTRVVWDTNNRIMDIDFENDENIAGLISGSSTIIMNGPFGMYESGYEKGTIDILNAISIATALGSSSILGGGDTVTVLENSHINMDNFSHVSTGGGAMLDYLSSGSLPAISVL